MLERLDILASVLGGRPIILGTDVFSIPLGKIGTICMVLGKFFIAMLCPLINLEALAAKSVVRLGLELGLWLDGPPLNIMGGCSRSGDEAPGIVSPCEIEVWKPGIISARLDMDLFTISFRKAKSCCWPRSALSVSAKLRPSVCSR